jgi:putative oxidoreductase
MRRLYTSGWSAGQSLALLALRLIVGTAFILHGWPKVQKPTSWMGPDGPPAFLQLAAAIAEFGGGIALILGFLTPFAAGFIAIDMIAAMLLVHFPKGHKFVNPGEGSYELPLVFLGVMIAFIAIGPGRYSLDAALWGRNDRRLDERDRWKKPSAA